MLLGSDALVIRYTNHRSQAVAETLLVDPDGRVRLGTACYA